MSCVRAEVPGGERVCGNQRRGRAESVGGVRVRGVGVGRGERRGGERVSVSERGGVRGACPRVCPPACPRPRVRACVCVYVCARTGGSSPRGADAAAPA